MQAKFKIFFIFCETPEIQGTRVIRLSLSLPTVQHIFSSVQSSGHLLRLHHPCHPQNFFPVRKQKKCRNCPDTVSCDKKRIALRFHSPRLDFPVKFFRNHSEYVFHHRTLPAPDCIKLYQYRLFLLQYFLPEILLCQLLHLSHRPDLQPGLNTLYSSAQDF